MLGLRTSYAQRTYSFERMDLDILPYIRPCF